MTAGLDVVVPAHNEQALIGAGLRALLSDAAEVELRVIVVANGCTDDTAAIARRFVAAARCRGHDLLVVETPTAGKIGALNLGDTYRRGCSVAYLDADTVLTPGTVTALVEALAETSAPRVVAPRPILVRPHGRLSRSFAAVWSHLPAVADQVSGAGCYAVNPAGRARWGRFPAVTGDDAYVRSRFAPAERRVVDEGGSFLVLPEGRELIRVVNRWRRGNVELTSAPPAHPPAAHLPATRDAADLTPADLPAADRAPTDRASADGASADGAPADQGSADQGSGDRGAGPGGATSRVAWPPVGGLPVGAGAGRNLATVLARPALWPHLPGFLVVNRAGRFAQRTGNERTGRWERAERQRGAPAGRPARLPLRVDVVVVTYRNRGTIDQCVANLRSSWADLTVTVVDNASDDGTVEHLLAGYAHLRVIRNRTNVGFAAGVNQGAARGDGDYLLMVNPDAELADRTIDELLALATRFSGAGLYGGRPVDDSGRMDPDSALARPSLWHALAFGSGLATLRGVPMLDPDSLGGWRRDDVRVVPVLTGGMLLVDRTLWNRLAGFDERYFLYGEDVDLSVRAVRAGATPTYTPRAGYRHRGGVSSTPTGRTIGIMRGKATLYATHLPPWRARLARLARLALLVGVGLRSVVARWIRSEPAATVWTATWRQRHTWIGGWPPRSGPVG